jgi:WD40 repeat protein
MEGGAAPAPIELGEMVFALCWLHPPAPLIASGTISGALCLHRLKRGEGGGGSGAGTAAPPTPTLEQRLTHHTDSCRTVCCAGTTKLFSASADKSVALSDLGGSGGGGGGARVSWQQQGAHAAAINVADEVGEASHPAGLIVTGDDEGCLKLWDVRQSKAVMEFHDHEDFVSSVAVEEAQRTLVSCSGDGTLAAYNLRRAKLERRSDQLEDELLSCALLKGEACEPAVSILESAQID